MAFFRPVSGFFRSISNRLWLRQYFVIMVSLVKKVLESIMTDKLIEAKEILFEADEMLSILEITTPEEYGEDVFYKDRDYYYGNAYAADAMLAGRQNFS